jgi:carboxyl-terminal processing protease
VEHAQLRLSELLRLKTVITVIAGAVACSTTRPSTRARETSPCETPLAYRTDTDALWTAVRDRYAYLPDKAVNWERARQIYDAQADTVTSRRGLLGVLERLLDEIYDAHATLRTNSTHSFRIVPSGADLWAEWRNGKAIVTAVRSGFAAEQAGIHPGLSVLAINGVAIDDATSARLGAALMKSSEEARQWAVNSALAGRHDTPRVLRVAASDGKVSDVVVDAPGRHEVDAPENLPPVEWRSINGSIGYVRLNALGDGRSVAAFDSALEALRETSALVIDLRNTPGGGNTSVAEPIMGRLISREEGYQRVIPRAESAYGRRVSSRGPWTYTKPIVVLVNRWTGSMGEGMAIGLDGMHRATVVGTRMAGLAGAVDDITLPCSGFRVGLPTARLSHVDGTPRERWVPPVLVDLVTAPPAVDPILARALKLL